MTSPRFVKPDPYVVSAADLLGFSAGVLRLVWKQPAESFEVSGRTGRVFVAVVVDCRTRNGTMDRSTATAALAGAIVWSPAGVLSKIAGVEAYCTMFTFIGDPLGLLLVPVEEP